MSEAKHTPAPWVTIPEFNRWDWEPRRNGGCVTIGGRDYHGMTCDDARLIAAAPDLLAALEAILRCDCRFTQDDARAAIAKAKGEA